MPGYLLKSPRTQQSDRPRQFWKAPDFPCFSAAYKPSNDLLLIHLAGNVDTRFIAPIQNPDSLAYLTGVQLKLNVAMENLHWAVEISLPTKFAVIFPG